MSSAVISLLWPNAQDILLALAARGRRAFVTSGLRADVADALLAGGVELAVLPAVTPAAAATATAASLRLPALAGAAGFDGAERERTVAVAERILGESFAAATVLIDALETVRAARAVDGLLLSEAETGRGAAALAWARTHGIPVALVGHGLLIGTYHGAAYAPVDAGAVFVGGQRGVDNQIEGGVPAVRCHPLGSPAFDGLQSRAAALHAVRPRVRAAWGIAPDAPAVLFATSFLHKLSAVDDPARDRATVERFVSGCLALRAAGTPVEIVVKGRPAIAADTARATIAAIAREHAVDDIRYVEGEMGEAIAACDALVVLDSAAALEAAVLGVPAVNLWDLSSWTAGPAYAEPDALPLAVTADDLARELGRLLNDPGARSENVAGLRAALPRFHAAQPGGSAAAIAAKVDQMFQPASNARRYVWELLSNPADAASDPELQQYYNHGRTEVASLVDREPRRVIEFGCAGGGTGALIKARYPNAEVIGIELNESAAAIARTRLDRVLAEDIETIDYASHGIAPGSVDAVLFADVLEHLRDPWRALVNLRPFLSPRAQVVCSIPNVRNLWLMDALAGGDWTYAHEGLLDITHIRFFTLREIRKMFAETGYVIGHLDGIPDSRGAGLPPALPEMQSDVTTPNIVFRGLNAEGYNELRTLQFLIVAHPAG